MRQTQVDNVPNEPVSAIGNNSEHTADTISQEEPVPAIGNNSEDETQIIDSGRVKNEKSERIICAWRFYLTLVTGIVFAIFAFRLLKANESNEFQNAFDAQAEVMYLYTKYNLDTAFLTLEGLSISTTSVVKQLNATTDFPAGFINIPDVRYNLGMARHKSNALAIAYMPKVLNEDSELWKNYSSTHKNWVSLEQPDGPLVDVEPDITPFIWEFSNYNWEIDDEVKFDDIIYEAPDIDEAHNTDDFYTPVWQLSPIPIIDESNTEVRILNYDLADRFIFSKAVEYMENSRSPVLLSVHDQSDWFLINEDKDILQTVLAYPVFGDFKSDSPIVGYFAAIVPWVQFFKNSLGPNSDKMIIVVDDNCHRSISIAVEANEFENKVEIIGRSNRLHDEKYEHMGRTYRFARDYNQKSFSDFPEEMCLYDVTMYPTREFEQSHRTGNRPIIISILIILVFIALALAGNCELCQPRQ